MNSQFLKLLNTNKSIAVLIDPDQNNMDTVNTINLCVENQVDFIFVGGSIVTQGNFNQCIQLIKSHCQIPVYIFPGNELMIDDKADGILFLSLLSGRNPEYLIGKHVVAAPSLASSSLDVVPTAYLLIDGGRETSVSYISNTKPIPNDKPSIAVATALAGKLLGMQCVYLDAGSGANHSVNYDMVNKVKTNTQLPLIIGGGIKDADTALMLFKNGADVIVIGNGVETNPMLIKELNKAKQQIVNTATV